MPFGSFHQKLFLPLVEDCVVDNTGHDLHAENLEQETEYLPEKGIARKYLHACLIVFGDGVRQVVPYEHDECASYRPSDQQHDIYPLFADGVQMAGVRGGCWLLQFPVQSLDDLEGEESLYSGDD